MLTPEERKLRAQIAALSRHARADGREATRAATEAFLARFRAEVDPDGSLPEDERERRARRALQAHMLRLALRSARARRRRAEGSAR